MELTGVAAASDPTAKIKNCWIRAPPLFPSGLPITSIAALPFVLDSLSSGIYAISLQGSNKEYLELLLRIFWAAPTITAIINGVVPRAAVIGLKKSEKTLRAKNDSPVTPII